MSIGVPNIEMLETDLDFLSHRQSISKTQNHFISPEACFPVPLYNFRLLYRA